MKITKVVFETALGLVVLVGATSAAQAQKLASAEIRFDTMDNDKDHDTFVNVEILRSDGYKAASVYNVGGKYNDHSSHTVGMSVFAADAASLSGASLRIWINTNGNDKWDFSAKVTLRFDDRSERVIDVGRMVLTQDDSQLQRSI